MKNINSGIYAIVNLINNKVYVGKSKNINRRWQDHKNSIFKNSKDANRHLKNAVNKYGINNFNLEVLEEISIDKGDGYFNDKELFWMDYLNSCDRENGYNLRRDSSTRMFVSKETRELQSKASMGVNNPNYGNNWNEEAKKRMSEIKKSQYESGVVTTNWSAIKKGHENKVKIWEENPQLKKDMAKRVSEAKSLYNILKINIKTLKVEEIFNTFMQLKEKYPETGKTVVFSACNGHKKSYKGYYWRYQDKNTLEIIQPKGRYGQNTEIPLL